MSTLDLEEFVTIFADRNFKGGSRKMGPGSFNLDYGQVGDNNISSIAIPNGWTVIVYVDLDCKGEAKTFTASAAELGSFDDKISSIVIKNPTVNPKGSYPADIPQLVTLTFDDNLNTGNYSFYDSLSGRNNPNG